MNIIKQISILLLAFTVVGCGGGSTEKESENIVNEEVVAPTYLYGIDIEGYEIVNDTVRMGETVGGILGRRDLESDREQMAQYEIPEIDLVIVDLYPFEQTVASGAPEQAIIEKIDIGGISLIRAGAKNFNDVIIVPSKAEYQPLLELLQKKGGESDIEDRKWFAAQAFGVSSHYDTAIHEYFVK